MNTNTNTNGNTTTTTKNTKEEKSMNTTTTKNTTTNNNTNGGKSAMNTTTTNNNIISVITFVSVARKNEKCLVWDIRNALSENNHDSLLSLCKAWVVMLDGNDTTTDQKVVGLVSELVKVAYAGKYASIKERKDGKTACLDVITSGRVKAWLYTIRRNGYKALSVVDTHATERPEEKAVKSKDSKKKVVMTEQEFAQYMEWKKASEKAC